MTEHCSKARRKAGSSNSPAPAHGRRRTRALEALIDGETARADKLRQVDIDMKRVERLDTFGAWLLERLVRAFTARGCQTNVTGLNQDYRALIDELHAVKPEDVTEHRSNQLTYAMASIGQNIVSVGQSFAAIVNMLGALVVALLRVLVHPRSFRFTSLVHQLDNVAWRAVPIILLITFLIGCIIAQQGIFHFRKFGADIYVVDMVTILVLRELGVLIVAIMVAGRSGSAYTAELGAMKMREEIDALDGAAPPGLGVDHRLQAVGVFGDPCAVAGELELLTFGRGYK